MKNILTFFNEKFYNFNQNNAFTLAEVLIVIAIIGIIASFTIPTLVNKVQKHEYVVELKKFYTTQEDGWSRLLADEGVSNLDDTSVFKSIKSFECSAMDADSDNCRDFYNSLKKYFRFNIVNAPDYQMYRLNGAKFMNLQGEPCMVFSDGSIIVDADFQQSAMPGGDAETIRQRGGHMFSSQTMGGLMVDVNGFKKPNTQGRDIFSFELSGDGKLYPDVGKDTSLFMDLYLDQSWRNYPNQCGTPGSSVLSASVSGGGCAARIMEEGWEMNY